MENELRSTLCEEKQKNFERFLALEDNLESIYEVDLETNEYDVYLKGKTYSEKVNARLVPKGDFFDDTRKNSKVVVYPEDRDGFLKIVSKDFIIRTLEKQSHIDWYYRLMYDEEPKWFKMRIMYKDASKKSLIFGLFNAENEKIVRHLEQTADVRKVVDNVTAAYNIVYVVNMDDDSVDIRRLDAHMKGDCDHEFFSSIREYFLTNIVHPRDRKRLTEELQYENIRQRLRKEPIYTIEYNALRQGITHMCEMSITALGRRRFVLGMSEKDEELIRKTIEEQRYEDYFALYVADIDTEKLKIIKDSPWYRAGEIGEALPYEKAVRSFAESIEETETREFFYKLSDLNYVKSELARENKRTYTYKSAIIDGNRWVDVTSYVLKRNDDGTPALFTLGFSLSDSLGAERQEYQREFARNAAISTFFINSYATAFYADLNDGSVTVLRIDESLKDGIELQNIDFVDSISYYINYCVHPDDREKMAAFCDVEKAREQLKISDSISCVFRDISDNDPGTYRCTIMRGEDESHVGIGFRNITEEVRQQEEYQQKLQDALSMAESASRAKTTFLNNMSHDIRTPMNAIIGFTELAMNHIDNHDLVQGYLAKIGQSSSHLLSLINDVLDMSRIESGKMCLEEKEENLSEIINSIIDIVQADIGAKQHNLHVDYNVDDDCIMCDKLRLNQVLLNILSNSIKYTPPGGSIHMNIVEKSVSRPEPGAEGVPEATYVFTISDNGMGMDENYLRTIYVPFTRVKSSTVSGIEGTGLGMSITKNIIDMMGGTINVESEPDHGTTMTVTLRFKLQDGSTIEEDLPIDYDFTGRKLLLVEDNELNHEIATELLHELGFVVDSAWDGDEAVEKMRSAKTGDYDLVLMDIQMPRLDGFGATSQIRALGTEISRIPIVAMTANAFEEDRRAALDAGMNEHISKPFELTCLKDTLAKFL